VEHVVALAAGSGCNRPITEAVLARFDNALPRGEDVARLVILEMVQRRTGEGIQSRLAHMLAMEVLVLVVVR
jgi:hypothetical protein